MTLDGWLKVTCRLTACTPGSALGPTLSNEYGNTLPYLTLPIPGDRTLSFKEKKTVYSYGVTTVLQHLVATASLTDRCLCVELDVMLESWHSTTPTRTRTPTPTHRTRLQYYIGHTLFPREDLREEVGEDVRVAFHDIDTDTDILVDILARIVARMSAFRLPRE